MSQPAAPPSTTATPRVLVVDDEPDLRTLYELTLLREGYRVDAAEDLSSARSLLADGRFNAVITDMRLPDGQGLELISELAAAQRSERCIVITAFGSAESAVEALKTGAFDYLTKPVDLKRFRGVVAAAVQSESPVQKTGRSAAQPSLAGSTTPGERAGTDLANQALQRLVGQSQVMRALKDRVLKVARTMAPVLVWGESGAGKELVARAIHASSHRSAGPFIAVNCGAIPETLLEAEFFGARKGSYTGSTHDREGFFQAARTGTLFLDEIGDLPLAMQSKLLRAIQERSVRPIGATQEEEVDVRIISATHRHLADEVRAGRFRQDLYYRLNVIEMRVPALRERLEDLPELCDALLARIARETGVPKPRLSPAVLEQLRDLPLPGNVRELENVLHRAVALGDEHELCLDVAHAQPVCEPPPAQAASHAALAVSTTGATAATPPPEEMPRDLQAYLDDRERDILIRALQETGFNRTAAAARLGLSLRQMRYRIARLNIAAPE